MRRHQRWFMVEMRASKILKTGKTFKPTRYVCGSINFSTFWFQLWSVEDKILGLLLPFFQRPIEDIVDLLVQFFVAMEAISRQEFGLELHQSYREAYLLL
jgi:hypothetical protein